MCLGVRCAHFLLRGRLVVCACLVSPTPQGRIHTLRTRIHTRAATSVLGSGLNALEKRTGWTLGSYFSYVWQISYKPLFPEDWSGKIRGVYSWKSHGVNFGMLLFLRTENTVHQTAGLMGKETGLTLAWRRMLYGNMSSFNNNLRTFLLPLIFFTLWNAKLTRQVGSGLFLLDIVRIATRDLGLNEYLKGCTMKDWNGLWHQGSVL